MVEITETGIGPNELETVVEAGKILMASGAEISRIEDTMAYMASALQIGHFDAYVVNRGIFATGINRLGVQEARVVSTPESSVHLGRIEAVNSLSREISIRQNISCEEIARRLRIIGKETVDPLWTVLLVYFLGAGSFSLAIGSTQADSLSSAVSGLIMGLVLNRIQKHIHSSVLTTMLASTTIAVTANLLYICGLGSHRGLTILGGLMLLVPGAVFTNSVREFSQNNYATGLTLLMSALLTSLSMAVGVVLATEMLPFADQMTSVFSTSISSSFDIALRTVMAGVGTVAFSWLYHAPRRYYPELGLMGAMSWLLYLVMNLLFEVDVISVFISALFATLFSRFLAANRKCPTTIFLSTSIFPLIPGLSFFRGVYFLMTRAEVLGWTYMRSCFISAFAIAIAISIVQQIPTAVFSRLAG